MIKTLFFPFSHISKDQLKTITTFFPKVGFLPPAADFKSDPILASLAQKDILQPVFASVLDLGLVEKQVSSYMDWAQLHRGNEKNFQSLLKDQPYFVDDTGISNIQSQIRSGIQKKQDSSDRKKVVPDPLLLLKFAQLLDSQNEGIDDSLKAVEHSQASLFSKLLATGPEKTIEKPAPGSCDLPSLDPGRIMTEERVKSWFRYASKKKVFNLPGASPLLITTSPAVLDYMESKSKGVINALDKDFIKVHENGCENKSRWQQDFCQFLEEVILSKNSSGIIQPGADDGCFCSGQIKLRLFPEDGMEEFFDASGQSIAVCLIQLKS
ncbi:MAG: hypothetical protein GY710_17790 [Desulfobacteraceae bacterium]|nr:hypothetical protein [Desulfobacteraceae bacterium]